MDNYKYLLQDLTKLKGVGNKTATILKRKKINNLFDLLFRLPQSYTDRTQKLKVNELQVGKITTINIIVKKYSFPRIRNLPNKVICEDETGTIDCVFFNSYEGYIRKILPLNKEVTISGKINYFKKRYQITNPNYVSKESSLIEKIHNKYSLTEGISEKVYNKIINQILENLPNLSEWLNPVILNKFENISWRDSIIKLHDPKNIGNFKSNFYRRLVFDEILKPSQNYNLASELKMEILDREALILQIFEKRSSSAESKLQVKLAQARYDMSRAKEKVRLSKKGEQPGFMGLGTFEVDVYYNEIKKRMINIKSKLVKSGKQRKLHRQARKRLGFKTISLAGYTSAGKTTLFNALTGEQREKNDELFTTLSTTVRRVMINREIALISDTVGFISRLPAYMIEAFKSTLEELLYTDVIIFVIDASDNLDELRKKFKSCYTTLNEIGVESNKLVFALNKSELLDDDEILDIVDYLELKGSKKWIDISAVTGKNMNELKKIVNNIFQNDISQNSDKVGAKTYGN